jgi:hypothetical protein
MKRRFKRVDVLGAQPGVWERKYGRVLDHDAVDLGYRLVVAMDRLTQDGISRFRARH